jgi:hypothetical protein
MRSQVVEVLAQSCIQGMRSKGVGHAVRRLHSW